MDRFEEIFSAKSEEIQSCLSSYSIDLQKFSEEFFLILVSETEERLSSVIDIVVKPDIGFLSYANIRKKKRRSKYLKTQSCPIDEGRDLDAIDGEDASVNE